MKPITLWIAALLCWWTVPAQEIPTATAALTPLGLRVRLPDAAVNRAWTLERSSNLVTWSPVLTNAGQFNNNVTFTNLSASAAWFRWRPYLGPPRIQWGIELQTEAAATELAAGVAGSLPLTFIWFRDEVWLGGENWSVGTSARVRFPPFTWRDNGAYRLVAENALGSVTSAPVIVNLPEPDVAPAAINGRVIEIDVQRASFPFAAPALYRLKPAAKGLAYVIEGLIGVPNSTGTYTYRKTSGSRSQATFSDSLTGNSVAQLEFTTAGTGKFTLSKPGLTGTASGDFAFQP